MGQDDSFMHQHIVSLGMIKSNPSRLEVEQSPTHASAVLPSCLLRVRR